MWQGWEIPRLSFLFLSRQAWEFGFRGRFSWKLSISLSILSSLFGQMTSRWLDLSFGDELSDISDFSIKILTKLGNYADRLLEVALSVRNFWHCTSGGFALSSNWFSWTNGSFCHLQHEFNDFSGFFEHFHSQWPESANIIYNSSNNGEGQEARRVWQPITVTRKMLWASQQHDTPRSANNCFNQRFNPLKSLVIKFPYEIQKMNHGYSC